MLASVFFCLVLCAVPILAQVAQPIKLPTAHARFERINTANGLSNNEITCIFQDRDGFMWFGTADGLNKYDGYTMTVYRSDDARPWTTVPSNQINAITQDEAGNVWVATKSGVAILNRQTQAWERFPKGVKDSLGKPVAYNAANMNADKRGNIWIISELLFRYHVRSQKLIGYVHPIMEKYRPQLQLLKADTAKSIPISPWSYLLHNSTNSDDFYITGWTSANTEHLSRYNPHFDTFDKFLGYVSSRRNALADDGENLWYGIEQRMLGEKGIVLRLGITNKQTGKTEILPTIGTPFAACVVGDEVWFGVFNSGIARVNRTTKKLVGTYTHNPTDAESLPSNMVMALYRDRTGCVWVGTGEGGIAKLVRNPIQTLKQNFLDSASLPSNIVQAVCEDSSGTLWVGTRKGLYGIERGTGKGVTYQRQHPIQPIHINDIVALCLEHSAAHPERNTHLWVASWGMGVQLFDIAERRFPLPPQPIQAAASNFPITGWSNTILQTAPDSLMFNNWGTHFWTLDLSHPEAINTFISRNEAFTNFRYKQGMKLYPTQVSGLNHIIVQDREGTLWAGGEGGGALDACGLFRRKTGEDWKLIATAMKNDSTRLPSYIIHAIYESTRGDLWLGTADGLCRFDRKTLRVRRFSLPNNVVFAIQEDAHGHLWCGTAKGLVEFDPAKEVVVRVLRPIDGLPSWSFNRGASMKSRRTGELFFGTNEGLCWFHPDSLRQADVKPLVAFTKCSITRENGTDSTLAVQAGTAHFAGGAIELFHHDKGFSFEMAALDFKSPADNEYAYKLDGFDKDWNSSGNRRFASYTSLPDGEYTLRIKAANADGVWNEAATTLRIRVRPPFWRTWWFLSLGVIAVLGSTVSSTRFVLRRRLETRLAKERLEQQIERERLEKALELERERRRISQDIHDEVGAGLTKILMLSQSASENTAQPNKEISTTAQGVIDGMQEIIWSINPKNDTLQSLVAFIRSYGREFTHSAGMIFIFDTPEDLAATPLRTDVRRNVFLAVKEALNNAVKYSAATEIRVGLEIQPSVYIFTIADNGKGFVPDAERLPTVRGGNGLENMLLRMEEIGGSFCMESVLNEGTRIVLSVPI